MEIEREMNTKGKIERKKRQTDRERDRVRESERE